MNAQLKKKMKTAILYSWITGSVALLLTTLFRLNSFLQAMAVSPSRPTGTEESTRKLFLMVAFLLIVLLFKRMRHFIILPLVAAILCGGFSELFKSWSASSPGEEAHHLLVAVDTLLVYIVMMTIAVVAVIFQLKRQTTQPPPIPKKED